jgi:lipopolysaccharide/colanic/teichoic acid biosynthesis glycosyltransferase
MKELMGKGKGNGNGAKAAGPPSSHSHLYDGESGLYLEEIFRDFLKVERKRAERSNRTFLLMLLHIGNAVCDAEKQKALEKITCRIISLTRETDIKGWYKQGTVLGIIFTETNGTDKDLLRGKIEEKVCEVVNNEKVGQIKISLHVFPEEKDSWQDNDNDPSNGVCDLTLYTDLSQKNETRKIPLIAKRIIDVIGSLFGIVLFSPFFLIIPLCIKLTSRGPVLFRQERVGQYGKRFTFFKFRSMQTGCDANIHKAYVEKLICKKSSYRGGNGNGGNDGNRKGDAKQVYKICDDPRVTPVGKFLRKTSLDELPQFFNVLKGDMSLVGPRPPIPYELENYDVWHRRRIHEVKPGITGLWQVKGRSSTNFDEMVRLDLQYSREWSLWLDLKLIIETPLVLIIGKGAY